MRLQYKGNRWIPIPKLNTSFLAASCIFIKQLHYHLVEMEIAGHKQVCSVRGKPDELGPWKPGRMKVSRPAGKEQHLKERYWWNSLPITAVMYCADWLECVWEGLAWQTGMTWVIQWEFLFSTGPHFSANFHLDPWSNMCWKPIIFLIGR